MRMREYKVLKPNVKIIKKKKNKPNVKNHTKTKA